MPSSIFEGQRKLNSQYKELTFTQLIPAINQPTAIIALRFDAVAKLQFFDSTVDADLNLYLMHPDADPAVVTNKLFWIQIPANRVLDISTQLSMLSIPAGTMLYVSAASIPTSGKLRVFLW